MLALKKIIKEKGYTQQRLADEIGITQGSISMFIKDIKKPSVTVVEEMARLLEVTPNDILGWDSK